MLLGINSDTDRQQLKRTIKKERLTWRSWWDKGSTNGPIQTQWQVTRRPTIFVLDAKGVIRHKDGDEQQLAKVIDRLLKEVGKKE